MLVLVNAAYREIPPPSRDFFSNIRRTRFYFGCGYAALEWVALIRELLDKPNIRIFVAIREEDLARRRTSDAELGFPADIALEFTEVEAGPLYERLVARGDAVNTFPSFLDAWERFGGEGPLLEFVYLVTQTDSLREVLEMQVQRLRDEVTAGALPPKAISFLHLCAVATAYEARVRLRPLAEHFQIPEPVGLLQKLEDEYLLRKSSDRSTVEALHPYRPIGLAEILNDLPSAQPPSVRSKRFRSCPKLIWR